ncbi:MAG: phosphatidate cytidylyltransferase [Oscillospiraceae bacterium]
MKQRILSAVVALVLLTVALLNYDTLVFNVFISLIGVVAVFELLHSTHYVKSKLIIGCSSVYALVVPFFETVGFKNFGIYVTVGYFVVLFSIFLKCHDVVKFEEIAISFFVSLVIPVAFSMTILMRDYHDHGIFYTLLVCVAAWITDTAAYFSGRAFGKHKMAPLISPHKTIEGAVGGLLASTICYPLVCLGYQQMMLSRGTPIAFSWGAVIALGFLCSLAGMAGDLIASVIKRQTGIKDFGNIMPGHGGIMDRFDSFVLVAPTFYLLIQLIPVIRVGTGG